ncbi:von Willebrand factor A domain-containing protein 3A-like [Corticium candelabrum]|uniref:von Willebrand factor A domain-containing protein 3A-like n=1 Tax=Corticium candelabrum TaxID=121492 RepID=UPI002E30E13E|nr:von Willebrand factor A domain-containing protein 3A-like [Corticium candelabrum]
MSVSDSSDFSGLSESSVTSVEYSSYDDDSRECWKDANVEGSKSSPPLLCTTVSHHHERQRLDNFRVPAFESHTTVQWLSYNSLSALHLTLKEILLACQPKQLSSPQSSAEELIHGEKLDGSESSSVIVSRLDVDLQRLQPFETRLERVLELHVARRNWLLQGSRKVFGQLTGSRVAVIFDVSESTCGLGQLRLYIESLKELLLDQLKRKSALFLACIGSTVWSLWDQVVSIDDDRIKQATDWILSLSSSPGCNVLGALRLALQHRKHIDEITLVMGGRPDQSMSLIVDYVAECMVGQPLPIHTVAYNCSETDVLDFLKEIACLSGGTYHCHSDVLPDSEDITGLEKEIQRVQDVIDHIKALKYDGRERTLSLLLREVSDETDWMSPVARTSSFLTSPLVLESTKKQFQVRTSKDWLQSYSLKSLGLTLYQVLAPNSFSQKDGYCAIINKKVSAHIYDDHMAQIAWHDGSIKYVHVDPAQLEDYQRQLDGCVEIYRKRIDWLCNGSRRVFGAITEKRVAVLLDISFANLEQLSRFQEHFRLLLEEQLFMVKAFNLICFASESTKWKPSLVETTTENLQDAWRWVIGLDFGGSCNLLSAFRMALEYEHDPELNDDPDAIYVVVSNHPDQEQVAVLSYIEECLVGRSLTLHTIFYDSSTGDIRSPRSTTTRHYDKQEMSHYLSSLAHSTDGRYHTYSDLERGCAEGDDLQDIHDEITNLENYHNKASLLLTRADQIFQNRLITRESMATPITGNVLSKQPPREPRDTVASLARKRFIHTQCTKESDLVSPNLKPNQTRSSQPRYLIHSHFYTGYGNAKVMALDQVVLPKPPSFSLKTVNIPKVEERLSSKLWLKKYGLSKVYLNLNHIVRGLDCGHRTEHIATINREAEALHCCHQPVVTIKGVEWHLKLRLGELLEYESKLQRVIKRYEKRLEWLRSGSRGVFGTILEDRIVFLLDTSGTMAPCLHQLKLGAAALIWEQVHCNKIKFNVVRFSSEAVTWHESLAEPTEAACQSAVDFVSRLTAEGSTDLLQALELSMKIPGAAAVYLVMNGKPERSRETLLEVMNRLNADHHIPVHTVSFDCSDSVTNRLLKELAHQTCGRFHRCVGGNWTSSSCQQDACEVPSFEGDDLQHLAREINKAKQFLAQSSSYRKLLCQGKQQAVQ